MLDPRAIQRRTLRLLFVTQIISGVGVTTGSTVGALLAADRAGVAVSGLAGSAVIVGAATSALPAAAIVRRRGRRPSLAAGYFVAALGAMLVVVAALRGSIPLLFAGFFLFGGATTANLQARYAAVDLAARPPSVVHRLGDDARRRRRAAVRRSQRYGARGIWRPDARGAVLLFRVAPRHRGSCTVDLPATRSRDCRRYGGRSGDRGRDRRCGARAGGGARARARDARRQRDGDRADGDERGDGDDAGAHQERRSRCSAHAAHRRRRTQLSHRRHVRLRAPDWLADGSPRPPSSDFRGRRIAALR